MPQIYETINHFNKSNGLCPYRYIGSDQHDNESYYGSSADLKSDIEDIGIEYFEKRIIEKFDNIDNRTLRKEEAKLLKKLNVKQSAEFYNKSDLYAPGGGVKGMKHKNKKIVSDKWRESRKGWVPSEDTRALWREQRTGRTVSEKTKAKMSASRLGEKNANALSWAVTDPSGEQHNVISLRKWCTDNGYNYLRVYNQRDGFKLIKYGHGKGGPNAKK